MKCLVAEDDFVCRLLLDKILSEYGEIHAAADGKEALDAFLLAWQIGEPYDLITLDINMPQMSGHEVLKQVRLFEDEKGIRGTEAVKVIMSTASDDKDDILQAFDSQCEAYLVKPVSKAALLGHLQAFGLLK